LTSHYWINRHMVHSLTCNVSSHTSSSDQDLPLTLSCNAGSKHLLKNIDPSTILWFIRATAWNNENAKQMSDMMFMDPCIMAQFIKKNPTRCNNVSKFYYSIFIWSSTCFGRHTAHHQDPKTAMAQTLVLHTWRVVGHVVGGHCQAHCAWRLPTTRLTTLHVCKTRVCQCSFRVLMMGGVLPKTCWASYKYGIIKFRYIVASCWIFLYELWDEWQLALTSRYTISTTDWMLH